MAKKKKEDGNSTSINLSFDFARLRKQRFKYKLYILV